MTVHSADQYTRLDFLLKDQEEGERVVCPILVRLIGTTFGYFVDVRRGLHHLNFRPEERMIFNATHVLCQDGRLHLNSMIMLCDGLVDCSSDRYPLCLLPAQA